MVGSYGRPSRYMDTIVDTGGRLFRAWSDLPLRLTCAALVTLGQLVYTGDARFDRGGGYKMAGGGGGLPRRHNGCSCTSPVLSRVIWSTTDGDG